MLFRSLKPDTLSITFDLPVAGHPPGFNFAAGLSPANGGVLTVSLPQAVDLAALGAKLTVRVSDNAGQLTTVVRHFSPSFLPIIHFFMPLIRH